jgi:hypothetical protein
MCAGTSETALQKAAANGHTSAVRLLLLGGREQVTDGDIDVAARAAAKAGHAELGMLLLQALWARGSQRCWPRGLAAALVRWWQTKMLDPQQSQGNHCNGI